MALKKSTKKYSNSVYTAANKWTGLQWNPTI